LNGNLKQFSGGQSEFDLEATNVRQLFVELGARYPALAPHLEEGIAVAIDGEIFQDAWFATIGPNSEVHVIPKIAGG
jgi:molybdopterin converting factor small subunit